jgi:hypothetical protein
MGATAPSEWAVAAVATAAASLSPRLPPVAHFQAVFLIAYWVSIVHLLKNATEQSKGRRQSRSRGSNVSAIS